MSWQLPTNPLFQQASVTAASPAKTSTKSFCKDGDWTSAGLSPIITRIKTSTAGAFHFRSSATTMAPETYQSKVAISALARRWDLSYRSRLQYMDCITGHANFITAQFQLLARRVSIEWRAERFPTLHVHIRDPCCRHQISIQLEARDLFTDDSAARSADRTCTHLQLEAEICACTMCEKCASTHN